MAAHSIKPDKEIGVARKSAKITVQVVFSDDKKLWVFWPGENAGCTRFGTTVEKNEGLGLDAARATSIATQRAGLLEAELLTHLPSTEEKLAALPLSVLAGELGFANTMKRLYRTGEIKFVEDQVVKA